MNEIVEGFIQFTLAHLTKVPDMVLMFSTLVFALGFCYGIAVIFDKTVFRNVREYLVKNGQRPMP